MVNFDPDTAGANAAEKSIALLTEEGFTIKIVTLEGGLDPDRFIRERGVEAYKEALRESRRQADYLIERARMHVSRGERGAEGEGDELSAAAYSAHAGDDWRGSSLQRMRRRSWGSGRRCYAKSCGRRR